VSLAAEGADDVWPFPSDRYLHEWAPGVQQAQNAWLASIDSLTSPDRKTHELIRMVCTVIARQSQGVERHAKLAAEVGATWDEIAGAILLTEPAFGIVLRGGGLPRGPTGLQGGLGHPARRRRLPSEQRAATTLAQMTACAPA